LNIVLLTLNIVLLTSDYHFFLGDIDVYKKEKFEIEACYIIFCLDSALSDHAHTNKVSMDDDWRAGPHHSIHGVAVRCLCDVHMYAVDIMDAGVYTLQKLSSEIISHLVEICRGSPIEIIPFRTVRQIDPLNLLA
jgi:hypothetical protein